MRLFKIRAVAFVLVIILAGCDNTISLSQPPTGGRIELSVYFDTFENIIKRTLSAGVGAQISIAMYDWTVDALSQEIRRVVSSNAQTKVQILLSSEGGGGKDEIAICISLQSFHSRVEVRKRSNMHHKFAVIGPNLTLTGSPNWTKNSLEVEANNLVVINSVDIASAYRNEFERVWKNANEKC